MVLRANMGLRILAPYTDSDNSVTVRDGVLFVVAVRPLPRADEVLLKLIGWKCGSETCEVWHMPLR